MGLTVCENDQGVGNIWAIVSSTVKNLYDKKMSKLFLSCTKVKILLKSPRERYFLVCFCSSYAKYYKLAAHILHIKQLLHRHFTLLNLSLLNDTIE